MLEALHKPSRRTDNNRDFIRDAGTDLTTQASGTSTKGPFMARASSNSAASWCLREQRTNDPALRRLQDQDVDNPMGTFNKIHIRSSRPSKSPIKPTHPSGLLRH